MNKHKIFAALPAAAVLLCCLTVCGESAGSIYDTTVTYNSDATAEGAKYNSAGTDENAVLITGGDVLLKNITVNRESADSTGGDNASFYGAGAAILDKGGTTVIEGADINTSANGGAGVFSYGDGVIKISSSVIKTEKDASGGIHVAGGGTLYADHVTAETQGESSAAIRSDRGGGLMVITDGSYTSNGVGSPAVYCTANIVCKDAELAANGSEAVCIEGLNSLYLYDCGLSGNMGDSPQNDCTWNVILYQSMSGDSQVGNSTFQMTGGTLSAENGGMFYTTNTESTFLLRDVKIDYADRNDFFLRCTGNQNQRGWGKPSENGADCTFTAIRQEMSGDVIWDSVSILNFYMTDGSTLTGAFIQDETCAGGGGDGTANLTIDKGSKWIVTGDSVLTTLHSEGTITDENGDEVTVKGADGTVYIQGKSGCTVTVSAYEPSADLSGSAEVTDFDDAQVNNGSAETFPGADPGIGQAPFGGPGGGQEPPDRPGEEPGEGGIPPAKSRGIPRLFVKPSENSAQSS